MDDHSPVETPTTPHSPNFPLFPLDTSYACRRFSILSSLSTSSRRSSPTVSIPSSLLSSTIAHPLPIRPAKVTTKPRSRSASPAPTYHLRVQTSPPNSAAFRHAVAHLETQLVPLISVSSGLPHPGFPSSILQYHLLTHAQLDDLARFYHQVAPPVRETFRYPCLIPAWVSRESDSDSDGDADMDDETDLETKRRRWGRFIGLRGCDTPVVSDEEGAVQREIEEKMEREWQRGLERERDEARLREKAWRGW